MKLELALSLLMGGAPVLAHRGHDHGFGHAHDGHHGHGYGHGLEKPSFHGPPPPPPPGHGHEHEHHLAMEQLQVVDSCMSDVISLCSSAAGAQPPATLGDPFMDWMLLGSAEPPQDVKNVFNILDQLFDPAVLEPSVQHVTFYWMEESPQAPKRLVDSVASKVAEHHQQEELPQLALDLQAFGRQAMGAFEENTVPHVMARRLTELDAAQIQRRPIMLPFGQQRNDCLRSAVAQNLVSAPCLQSMQALEMAQSYPWLHGPHHHHGCPHHHMVFMVFVLPTIAAILLKMYFHKAMGAKGRMNRRLIAVVYKTPSLKAQVERELGQSLGEQMGCCQYFSQQWKKESFITKLLVASGMFFVVSAWFVPFAVVACFAIARRIVKGKGGCCCCCCCGATPKAARNGTLTAEQECCCCCKGTGFSCEACVSGRGAGCCCCCTSIPKVSDDCACCCCGATSSAARAGSLTAEQECCICCKGTGTCSDACVDCCTGGCSCDGKDCCCCAADDCTCCCCGATSSAARAGTLTAEQECCNCCKGTGTCSDACAACCAGGCSCDGKDCCCCAADDCTCCCCGATSSAARAGTLTAEQECCNCCKGTGTCSDACAACCAGGCSCDGKDCCCCDGTLPSKKGRGQKHVVPARKEVYEGIALQIV